VNEVELIIDARPLDCGTCRSCCQNNPGLFIIKELGDDPALYEGYLEERDGIPLIKTKSNGDCVFLDREKGCTAYDIRPSLCRKYDCRRDYIKWSALSRVERRALIKSRQVNQSVQKEGRRRLKKDIEANNVQVRQRQADAGQG